MIAMQSSDRRMPVPPDPRGPSDGPAREQRHDAAERTDARSRRNERLLARLEAGYEFHTMQLTQRGAPAGGPARSLDRHSRAAASRRALAVITAALRDMAEGRYGTCASCGRSIPTELLEARPEARHCLRCAASLGG
jgi:DnaK suppressor protein